MEVKFVDFLWPLAATVAIIFLLDFLIEKKKKFLNFFLVFGIATIILIAITGIDFNQVYSFLFLFSISLVILALKKQIDSFTLIGIVLMVVMLVIILVTPI